MMQYVELVGIIMNLYVSIFSLYSCRIKWKRLVGMIVITEIISLIFLMLGWQQVTVMAYLIIPCIFMYLQTSDVVLSISLPVAGCLIIIVWDYFLSVLYNYVFLVNQSVIKNDVSIHWITFGIEFIGTYVTSRTIKKFVRDKFKAYNGHLKGTIGVVAAGTLILMLFVFYNTNVVFAPNNSVVNSNTMRIKGIVLFFSYAILLIIVIRTILRGIIKEMELKSKENEFQSLQEYTNKLEKLHKDMRGFRHDYINILLSMAGYIQNRDLDGLERFFDDKIMPISKAMKSNNFKIGLLQNIEVPEIKGMFSAKIIRAQETGIDVYIDVAESIKSFNMEIIDLSRVIGILLDNAIEASEKCDKPSMKVAVINKDKSVMIVIINNYNEEIPPIYKIYKRGFSTKGDNRGIGLSNLKDIIGKYPNVMLDTVIEDNQFKQIIDIKNNIEEGVFNA
ncbi:ATPase [Clostridium acetobutylicum]|nr:ATPase [Clostridium acetobutylicum]